jgi:hypothetical protein
MQCRRGHRFKITPKNLMRGIWCAECRSLPRQSEFLKYAQRFARKNGGRCLANAYVNARQHLPWKCAVNHQWEASFDNVVNKRSWCPICAALAISDRKKAWWRKERMKRARSGR